MLPPAKRMTSGQCASSSAEYTVQQDETLALLPNGTVSAALGGDDLAVDFSGHFAYAVDQAGNKISQFVIGADGRLTPNAASDTAPTGTGPFAVVTTGFTR
jgi:hypothetical protein